ncbi:hypothetical protein QTG54_004404 [Skeletonema marinoi]|uniref:Uncharacterized protein n=1 Tax=Skeletonema marinoi TaxID=267567 RepID=A0AAD8YFT6_9STRA|nr:hypothetical protein QTG54_004404 [Skeletonema marinoi]
MMKAELVLSRSSYRAGSPVVGTVRIHCPPPPDATTQNDKNSKDSHSIRDDVVSARLYFAGRSYLGNKHKVSRWRSTQEMSNLQKLYGEDGHACLRMAKMEEMMHLQREQNDNFEDNEGLSGSAAMNNTTQSPEVTHIEQAERLAIHSHLHPKYNQYNEGANDYSHLPSFTENNTICFFMTNVLELLDMPERSGNFHEDMNPFQPLHLPDLHVFRDAMNQNNDFTGIDSNGVDEEYCEDYENESHDSSSNCSSSGEDSDEEIEQHLEEPSGNATTSTLPTWQQIMSTAKPCPNPTPSPQLERSQIVLSFRTDLPTDLPPTLSAECVKYFYSAVLVVTTTTGEILVATCPFAVLTANSPYLVFQKFDRDAAAARVHVGELRAVAHSNSLPTLISSTDVSTKLSQLNVIANPPVRSILSRRTAEQRTSTHRIQDSNGGLCGWMTLVGFGGPISPGTRLSVFVDFPNLYSEDYASTRIIGCHRVCCGLVGEEYAVCETGGLTTTGKNENHPSTTVKRKTRSYVFDSAYEMVEFGHTDRISMGLLLPSHCPVTLKTDLVEVTVTLKVEFTVDRASVTTDAVDENSSSSIGKDSSELGVISLDLPCEVVHSGIGLNEDPEDNEEGEKMSSNASSAWRSDNKKDDIFDESDVPDLNVLSLEMIKSFG